jgi:hypothetical protein
MRLESDMRYLGHQFFIRPGNMTQTQHEINKLKLKGLTRLLKLV